MRIGGSDGCCGAMNRSALRACLPARDAARHPPSSLGPCESQKPPTWSGSAGPWAHRGGTMSDEPHSIPPTGGQVRSGITAVDRYLDGGYASVPGMSSRFAAAVCCGLLRIQTTLAVGGPIAEIGPFEGRFFIAMAHALAPGETALGIDLFDWPNPEVADRFEANCLRHGVAPDRRMVWRTDSRLIEPAGLLAKLGGRRVRFFHIDGEHSRAALSNDLELATAVLAEGGLIV